MKEIALALVVVPRYIGTYEERIATAGGARANRGKDEKRILKVLKSFAEYHDMTLGDVLEGIVLHAFDGKTPFSAASLERIRELKNFYGLDLDSSSSHRLKEIKSKPASPRASKTSKDN